MIYGVKENKSFDNVIFTYVVDSDESLTSWAENKAGNDYTAVLIKVGSWNCQKSLDLTATGTKIVIGEAGSKLIFNIGESTQSSALSYSSLPDFDGHFMFNVSVVINRSENAIGFNQCVNLYNCSLEVNGKRASGFYKCENLFGCVSKCNATGSEYSACFFYSNGLNNCVAHATAEDGDSQGFVYCERLNSCNANITGNASVYGYRQCKQVMTSTIKSEEVNHTVFGFYSCKKLMGCIAVAKGAENGYAFSQCQEVVSCEGSGQYGFYESSGVVNCMATSTTIAKAYNTCANIGTYNETYAYANTANGGFNF